MFRHVLLILLSVVLALPAHAKQPRSSAARTAFVKANPCPATSVAKLPCKGYVIDHVVPLCAGGADQPNNMQWQSIDESKIKDKQEVKQCRTLKSEQRQ
jgi:hypothetical protein